VGNQELEAESLIGLALALARSSRQRDAVGHARDALAIGKQTGHGLIEGAALTALTEIFLATGDTAQAAVLAVRAQAIHEQTGHRVASIATALLSARIGNV
jgi:hypothetical protein